MGLMRFLGGVGAYLLGLFVILIGLVSAIYSAEACVVLVFIGFILLLVGKFYGKTAMRYTQVEMVGNKQEYKEPDRRCIKCGRVIPFDARICPYCKHDYEQ